jgi:hypothetical protein
MREAERRIAANDPAMKAMNLGVSESDPEAGGRAEGRFHRKVAGRMLW